MKLTKLQRMDVFVLFGVFLTGIMLGLFLLLTRQQGISIQIRIDGTVEESFSLGRNRTYEIDAGDGSTNLLIIRDGQAWIEEASCPDGLCVNMGKISKSGQSIVCLPNKVVVEIIGRETSANVDLIAK